MTVVASYLQDVGGVEQLLVDLVALAGRDGWDVTVVAPRRIEPGGALEAALSSLAPVVTAEACWQRRPVGRASQGAALVRELARRRAWPDRRHRASLGGERAKPYLDRFWSRDEGRRLLERADVVHVLGSHPFGARAITAAGALGRPVVYSETTTPTAQSAGDPYHRPFREALPAVTVATTHSRHSASEFVRHYGYSGPLHVVDQWLEGDLESRLLALAPAPVSPEGAGLVVGSLSRLADGKGLSTLLDAVARVVGEGHDVRLLIGGDGPAGGTLREHAATLGVGDRVDFTGTIAGARRAEFLGSLDVFATSSVAETGPYSGLEAMAAARAVITTPVGAMPDRLDHDASAWFCEIGDVAGFAGALAALAGDRARVRRLGDGARATFLERNRAEHLGALVQALWREAVGSAAGSSG